MRKHRIKASTAFMIMRLLALYGIVMTVLFVRTLNQKEETINQALNEKNNYEAQLLENKIIGLCERGKYESTIEDCKATITELYDVCEELDAQNKSLVTSNEEYYSELLSLKDRVELYERYDYALFFGGKRNDITYDQLKTLEECIEESSIPDTDLILSWIMCESHGFTNAKNPSSSAKGYGQFLDGTSRFVYTKLLGEKNWTPSVAYDGETNMRMMVAYTDYLYDYYGGPRGMLKGYTGSSDPLFLSSYESKLNRYLKFSGKSFSDMYDY